MSQFALSDKYRRPLCVGLLALVAATAVVDGVFATNSRVEGEALIAAAPEDPQSYITAAQYARERDELEAALEILKRGRSRVNRSADLLLALGDLYWQLERPTDALAAYREAVEIRPDGVETRFRLVTAMAVAADPAEAEYVCREYLKETPDSPLLLVALGECLEKREQLPQAFGAYGRAIEIDPATAPAHARRGRLFCLMGQYEAAVAACRTALEHDPDDALAHAYLGVACSELGRYWEAQIHAVAAEEAGMTMDSVWQRIGKWK